MAVSTVAAHAAVSKTRTSSLYHMVWKWHFFAALYVLPFMALLSITGGLYLFNDSIEEVIYNTVDSFRGLG